MPVVTILRRPEGSSCLGRASQREVVGLRPAARQHDLARVGVDEPRDARACVVEHRFGTLAEGVHGRRITKFGAEYTINGVDHLRGRW